MNLTARIRNSERLIAFVGWIVARYLRFCWRTTRWEKRGFDEMFAVVAGGQPVIIACWHQRLMFAPVSWDRSKGRAATLRAVSHAGRLSGAVQSALGLISVPMADDISNLTASRKIAKLMRDGVSLGITVDGPEGPARVANTAVLEWARLTGCPIYLFSFATQKKSVSDTWDAMHFPRPFTKGVIEYLAWESTVPRKPSVEDMEMLREKLGKDLDALTDDLDGRLRDPL